MAKLAQKITLTDRDILIDGESFPWHVTEDGVSVSPVLHGGKQVGEMVEVQITIFADRFVDERVPVWA